MNPYQPEPSSTTNGNGIHAPQQNAKKQLVKPTTLKQNFVEDAIGVNGQALKPQNQQKVQSDHQNGAAGKQGEGVNSHSQAEQSEQVPEPTFEEMMNQIDREHDSEDEGISDYKIGGYHPVHIGEVVNKRYVVIQKIGWGHFSTVWLAKDFKYDTYVALKIQKSAPHYMEAAFDEVEILQKVARQCKDPNWMKALQHYYEGEKKSSFSRDDCQVVQLLNSFVYKGPYGNHFCFVFEILGVNLLEVIKRYNYKGVPMHLCRKIAKQVLIGLDFLHRFCSVIHTDLKPENVLLQLTKEEIADIVENGQMTKNTLFKERLAVIRKHLGVPDDDKILPDEKPKPAAKVGGDDGDDSDAAEGGEESLKDLENKLKNDTTLSTRQKKNLRKRIGKMKKAEAEQAEAAAAAPPVVEEKKTNKDLFSQVDSKLLDKNKLMRGPQLDNDFKLKIADLGNACWTYHHFATEIQTRQYRSPEVIIGSNYNTTADVWSLACMLFEMLTGDFLFEPRKGPTFSKNDDHLAQIQELCRKFPKSFTKCGEKSKKYFDNNGNLRRIPQLQYWPLSSVLIEKYKVKETEARAFEDFMMQMLNCVPDKRATAAQMLDHPWLKGKTTEYEFKQTEQEIQDYLKKKQILIDKAKLQGQEYVDPNLEQTDMLEDDIFDGDGENTVTEDGEDYYNDEGFYGKKPKLDMKLVDRSFSNLGYIGFGEGIDLNALDTGANWQFSNV